MNFSRIALFHMKNRVCLRYFVHGCKNEILLMLCPPFKSLVEYFALPLYRNIGSYPIFNKNGGIDLYIAQRKLRAIH